MEAATASTAAEAAAAAAAAAATAAETAALPAPSPAAPSVPPRPGPSRRTGALPARPSTARRRAPSTEAIATLPPFDALALEQIVVVARPEQLAAVEAGLLAEPMLGFDTESKPVFQRGVTNDGPHLAQFAARGRAWLIPLHVDGAIATIGRIMESTAVRKIGFGLDSDLTLLRRRLGREPRAIHDLDADFRAFGYRGALGLKSAVAVLLGQRFTKSKRIGTSNWANKVLTPDQIRYAANDAWGAYCIHQALEAGAEPWDLAPPPLAADDDEPT